ncbi:Fructose-1,6-bisphosphatase [Coemansia spiralis]|uniref:Fructose-1,6-bisphosphatase n=2 Tax=Coemansia TaxID=4863 RepID=A0A9W8G9X7_9FUNG|nr:Fructose-1,6-bisphosphatase [Coemansia umbellata]KAJ2623971.1 Fructose-1,6-bisphosphatase [Coemansia sp. RSA 1358]KAJ2679242.1 Fructose-1,6-bisphosphatase [Coemansia spiralis]
MTDHHKTNIMTLTRYVLEQQRAHPEAKGDLTIAMNSVQVGCKFVEACVRKARLINLVGLAGNTNVQGEDQKKLDVLSNEMFVNALMASGKFSFMVSEEVDDIVVVPEELRGKYCITFDPLDGSSNIDAGVNVGTIFGIWRLPSGSSATVDEILVPGSEIIAGGYCMYGSSCNLVLTFGNNRVEGFTLDPALGEFILTHPDIRIPPRGKIYSVNEGNSMFWDDATKAYFDGLKFPSPESGRKPYSARYIGSMVADVHRTLLYGGVFAYPSDRKSRSGKLRILYESFPMAFITEQAGGKATTGVQRVLDLVPKHIHDRCPIFLGGADDIAEVETAFASSNNWLNGTQK